MTEAARDYPCDICRSTETVPIEATRNYTKGQAYFVCTHCGFVHARTRRSAKAIADAWSKEVFGGSYTKTTYTARIPHVKARQTFVAETLETEIPGGLKGKSLCDIGAGEGQFLDIVRSGGYGASAFGIEPSEHNGKILASNKFEHFVGSIEDWCASPLSESRRFDVVTIMWTLENCTDCRGMIGAAYDALVPGGYICVATGSRILVPFKKPLQYFLGNGEPIDLHAFHFSANSLTNLLAVCGFERTFINRYIDNDILCMIGRKAERKGDASLKKDDHKAIIAFFDRWAAETRNFYADA
ncbi:MAG: class I SAM-dependent methyltransferase [Xanthobacteraceae bacterium]|nr:class I SAM-dependent methyltransferase [Xanthobacteraceae bacterium]